MANFRDLTSIWWPLSTFKIGKYEFNNFDSQVCRFGYMFEKSMAIKHISSDLSGSFDISGHIMSSNMTYLNERASKFYIPM